MEHLSEKLLAQYYDGELSEKDRQEVERLLALSDEAQQSLEKMSKLSDCMQLMVDEQLANVSFDGFEKRVLNSLEKQTEPPAVWERIKVWASEFFAYRKVIWIPATSVAGAACAALLVLGLSSGGPTPIIPGSATGETWQASVVPVSAGSEAVLTNANQVSGQEYSVVNERGETIGVVWLQE